MRVRGYQSSKVRSQVYSGGVSPEGTGTLPLRVGSGDANRIGRIETKERKLDKGY